MYYIVVENDQISTVINYEPTVPSGTTVVSIENDDYEKIVTDKTHYFDVSTLTVKSHNQSYIDAEVLKKQQEQINIEKREFLHSTDWKVMRHIREKALGQTTTLTDQEYLDLEQDRADAAAAIIEIQ